jgi:serine/threonine-protein kinase
VDRSQTAPHESRPGGAWRDAERERGARIEGLLDELEEVTTAGREDFSARICADPELRREALSLLAAESQASRYLARFGEGLVPGPVEPPDLTGRHIGPYKLLRPLGRGGMGVVYEAARADGAFDQHVALKLLTTAVADTEAHERFLAERQILAGLEHPAIARMMDGGVTPDGTPWFSMEYVDGEPIDVYCDRHRLGIHQRLELLLQVCDAVDHAHRRLVIHRDLKPANVLVTEDRHVKLLDFGIAKLLGGATGLRATPATRVARRFMTPEYASPEQVRGEPVTTASDVYQLGLLLYELLTGHRPYTLRDRAAGELERVICEQAPVRPSAAILRKGQLEAATGASVTAVAEVRRVRRARAAQLRWRLRGDLDNIVLKALRKEPERRYGSADRLAQDLRRHVKGLPVTARPDTVAYRCRKFLQRHGAGAVAAAMLFVLAVAMVGVHTARIQSERDRAQTEAAKAEHVTRFLVDLFRSADPRVARGAEFTGSELLDRGVEQVERELADQPGIQADVLHVVGRTYMELGAYDRAEGTLTRVLELRRERLGPDHGEVAETLGELGLLKFHQGHYERARERLEEAASALDVSLGGEARELAVVLDTLGRVHRARGDYEASRGAFDRALAIQQRASGEDSEPVASILHNLGALLYETGLLPRSAALHERALAIYERELGGDHPSVGSTLLDLANVRTAQGELEGLERMYRRALVILENAYGPSHTRVAAALDSLGRFLVISGRHDEALDVMRRAVEVRGAGAGPTRAPTDPGLVSTLLDLGRALTEQHRCTEAVSLLQTALQPPSAQQPLSNAEATELEALLAGCSEEVLDAPQARQASLSLE